MLPALEFMYLWESTDGSDSAERKVGPVSILSLRLFYNTELHLVE